MTPFLGQLLAVAFNFAPKGWALCNGQLLAISLDQALFSLLGTTYGGNGQTNFALPNLQGRVPISSGQAPGLSDYPLGQIGGQESHTIIQQELPTHTHFLTGTSAAGTLANAAGNMLASSPMYISGPGNSSLVANSLSNSGGSQAHTNIQPYLVINWVIALQGIF